MADSIAIDIFAEKHGPKYDKMVQCLVKDRVRLVAITERGREVLADAVPLWQAARTSVIDGIGKKRLAGMVEDLNRLVEIARA